MEMKFGDADLVEGKALEIHGIVGHFLETYLDLFARVWCQVDMFLHPGRVVAAATGARVAITPVRAVWVRSWWCSCP